MMTDESLKQHLGGCIFYELTNLLCPYLLVLGILCMDDIIQYIYIHTYIRIKMHTFFLNRDADKDINVLVT